MGFAGGLILGIVAGLALGVVTVGFLAIAAYERGAADAAGQRKEWRAELVARRAAVRAVPSIATPAPAAPQTAPALPVAGPAPTPAAVPQVAAVTAVARKAS